MNYISRDIPYELSQLIENWKYFFLCPKKLVFKYLRLLETRNLLWHDVGIRCVGVGVGKYQSEDSFVCFGAKLTQRACARDFPRDRKRTREGRPQSQEESKHKRDQGREQSSRQKSGEADSQLRSQQKRAGACGLRRWVDQREKMSQHSWWLWEFRSNTRSR